MIYIFHTTVINVEEKFQTVRVKMVNGKPNSEIQSLGWFVRISESSAIGVGDLKPDLEKGDKVKITMEKVDAL